MWISFQRRQICGLALLVRSSTAFAGARAAAPPTTTSTTTTSGLLSAATATAAAAPAADYNELPLDYPRRNDVLIALEAVRRASVVTTALQPQNQGDISTVSKLDLSPVTVADFAAQAIVLRHLHETFEKDSFIAEESSQALTEDENLAQEVVSATSMESVDIVKQSIDLGKEYELWKERPSRVWCLDPIDGTRGFLRGKQAGGQYCVALALLEDGVPTIGVLGCPNLPANADDFDYAWRSDETAENNKESRGCIFVASKDGGCYQLSLTPGGAVAKKVQVTPSDGSTMDPSDARFCIGVEKFSDALGQCARTAEIIHGDGALTDDGDIVKARRIDSQAKYGVLARGGAEYYARFTKPGYVEWIWDHAAGNVVITEAGGTMSDTKGHPIDFSLGAKMSEEVLGVMGSNGGKFHSALIKAFQQQEEERLNADAS